MTHIPPDSLASGRGTIDPVSSRVVHAALGAAGRRPAPVAAARGGANARNFVARRDFAANPAFAPFVNNGWNGGYAGYAGWNGGYGGWNGGWTHLGSIGPLFWPTIPTPASGANQ